MWFEQIVGVCSKACRLPRSVILLPVLGLLSGTIISSAFWWLGTKHCGVDGNRSTEEAQLRDQIRLLREEKEAILHPSPTPTPLPYVEKESLSGAAAYSLSCFDIQRERPPLSWLESLEVGLGKEKLVQLCLNPDLNQAVLISQEIDAKDQGAFKFRLQVFDIQNNTLEILSASQGSYNWGLCDKVVAWSKTGNIYYQCGGADGPWGDHALFRVNVQTKAKGVAESCYLFEGKENCTHHCHLNTECQQGHFCNLETYSCVQPCRTDRDCIIGSCQGFGPMLGCKAIDIHRFANGPSM